MIKNLLDPKIQEFINANIGEDISKIALQKNPFPETHWIDILNQIEAKKKSKDKLPTFFATKNIIYPNKVSVEQTSSEKTAFFKSNLVSGKNLIDLTGGFGVDDLYFSKTIKHIVHCELNESLSEIVKHNFKILKTDNIDCITGDSFKILKDLNQQYDWIYIDPSRRNESKGKVFMLKDCLPNVPENLNFYFQFSNNILIKTAPILDIKAGLSELKNVKIIHIIAVDNEVKEVLWQIEKNFDDHIEIKTINITKENQNFSFKLTVNSQKPTFSLPLQYLYEPNAAIMKSGGFNQVGLYYKISKLHQHSHLYTSEKIIAFPGRIFKIENVILYHKPEMKTHLENKKANITARNFPETVENIRKKWKIKEGGNIYCFFTINNNEEKIVLICTKI